MPSGPTSICVVGAVIRPLDALRAPMLYDTSIAATANAPPTAPKAALMVITPCAVYIKEDATKFLGQKGLTGLAVS